MNRDAILTTKRLDLGNVITSRKRKLRELYSVTSLFATEPLHRPGDVANPTQEAAFLDANDITRGRFFNIASLERCFKVPSWQKATGNERPAQRERETPRPAAYSPHPREVVNDSDEDRPSSDRDDDHDASSPQRSSRATQADTPSTHTTSLSGDEAVEPLRISDAGKGRKRDLETMRDGEELEAPVDRTKRRKSPVIPNSSQDPEDAATPEGQLRVEQAQSLAALKDSERPTRVQDGRESPQAMPGPDTPSGATLANVDGRASTAPQVATPATAPRESGGRNRPNMRIDTQPAGQPSTFTPARTGEDPSASTQIPSSDRRTTRVSTGALRHRSVSEILGETPKSTHEVSPGERFPSQGMQDEHSPDTPQTQAFAKTPDTATFKSRLHDLKEREKERSKLSTVIFAGQQTPRESTDHGDGKHPPQPPERDYLMTLFVAQAATQQPPLSKLIATAHKTLSTDNHYLDFRESQACRILKKIYYFQTTNRWPLRQLERQKEPARPMAGWDAMLKEMKWMRTDFREERKWKIATAKNLADWCAEWVNSSPLQRLRLQVRVTQAKPKALGQPTPVSANGIEDLADVEKTPDLIPSAEDDANLIDVLGEDLPYPDNFRQFAPAAMFSLAPEECVFGLEQNPTTDKILSELPMYSLSFDTEAISEQGKVDKVDSSWEKPLLPVSKFATSKITVPEQGRKRKPSRFDYADNHEPATAEPQGTLPPESTDCALFDSENRPIISRLYSGLAFHHPLFSETLMPSQGFYECRKSSEWTAKDDEELRALAQETMFNWSLISNIMSSPSHYVSQADRRTPWECFERWVGLEGMPPLPQGNSFWFKVWVYRRQQAREHVNQLFNKAQQQAANSAPQLPLRRKPTEPYRVERRRNNRHLAMLHAFSKLAKRKEYQAEKSQINARQAAARPKPHVDPERRARQMQTPRDFSAARFKRDQELRERQQQMAIAQRNALLAQRAGHPQAQQMMQNLPPAARMAAAASMAVNGAQAQHPNPSAAAHQAAQAALAQGRIPSNHPLANAASAAAAAAQQASSSQANGRPGSAPQAQMQAYMANNRLPQQTSPDSQRVIMDAQRLREQQQSVIQARQFHPQTNGGSSASLNVNAANQAAVLANMQQSMNGKLSPAAPGMPANRPSSSSGQSFNPSLIPAFTAYQKLALQHHPNASPEELKAIATHKLQEDLHRRNVQNRQNAQHPGSSPHTSQASLAGMNGMQMSPRQQQALLYAANGANGMNATMYAQYIRAQQASQQHRSSSQNTMNGSQSPHQIGVGMSYPGHAGNGDMNGGTSRPGSRDTPQMANTRPGSASATQSPRPPQAQMAGGP